MSGLLWPYYIEKTEMLYWFPFKFLRPHLRSKEIVTGINIIFYLPEVNMERTRKNKLSTKNNNEEARVIVKKVRHLSAFYTADPGYIPLCGSGFNPQHPTWFP